MQRGWSKETRWHFSNRLWVELVVVVGRVVRLGRQMRNQQTRIVVAFVGVVVSVVVELVELVVEQVVVQANYTILRLVFVYHTAR